MSDISNAVAKLAISVQNEIAAVQALLANGNPDVNQAVAQLADLASKLDAVTAELPAVPVAAPAPVEPPPVS